MQTDLSRKLGNVPQFNVDGIDLSVRQHNFYVLAEGSVHPSGSVYEAVVNAPIVPIPDSLVEFIWYLKQKAIGAIQTSLQTAPSTAVSDSKTPLYVQQIVAKDGDIDSVLAGLPDQHEPGRDIFMTAVLGKLHKLGWSDENVLTSAHKINNNKCHPAIKDPERIAKSVCRYQDDSGVRLDGKKPGENPVSAKTTQPQISSAEQLPDELTTVRADKVETHRIRWIWPGYFAEKLNTISGDPGEGKGLLTCYLAGRVSTGTDFHNCKNTLPASHVLMMSNEDDLDDTLVPRLIAAKADLSKIDILQMVSVDCGVGKTRAEREFQLDRDMSQLEQWLLAHPETRLLIVDPVSNYLGDSTKMIDEKSVRKALMPLKKLAEKLHIAVVAVMHLNKKADQKHIYRISGAMGFVGVARMNWMCAKVPPDKDGSLNEDYEFQKVKGNIVARGQKGLVYRIEDTFLTIEGKETVIPRLEFIGYADKTLDQQNPGQSGNGDNKPTHRPAVRTNECEDKLIALLTPGPLACDFVLERLKQDEGFGRATVFRAANNLKVVRFDSDEKYTASDGKQYFNRMWRLPEPPPGSGQSEEVSF